MIRNMTDRRRSALSDARDPYAINWRLPLDLYRRLVATADRDNRPIMAEAVEALRAGLDVLDRRHEASQGVS